MYANLVSNNKIPYGVIIVHFVELKFLIQKEVVTMHNGIADIVILHIIVSKYNQNIIRGELR